MPQSNESFIDGELGLGMAIPEEATAKLGPLPSLFPSARTEHDSEVRCQTGGKTLGTRSSLLLSRSRQLRTTLLGILSEPTCAGCCMLCIVGHHSLASQHSPWMRLHTQTFVSACMSPVALLAANFFPKRPCRRRARLYQLLHR